MYLLPIASFDSVRCNRSYDI